jgi:Flp pilus assembly pilin Flp
MVDSLTVWLRTVASRVQGVRGEDGQALVEYTLILGLVSVVAIAVLTSIGTEVTRILSEVYNALAGVP